MAWLEKRGERFRIKFRYGGRNYQHGLKTENQREAEGILGRLEENLILLERGKLEPPADGNLPLFLLTDGKINEKPKIEPSVPLKDFFRRYRDTFTEGAKESSTRYTETIHMKHLERIIGPRTGVRSITSETLQRYIDERGAEKNRHGERVNHVTILKELGTLASIWNKWGVPRGLVSGAAPTRGLVYRKTESKFPFQTWHEIERRIERGGLTERELEALWDSLFLSLDEIRGLLAHVKKNARAGWVYPMIVFAAHTGARRSEMLRAHVDDVDHAANIVRIREKKRDRTKELTFRHVPMSMVLKSVMKDWLSHHPGGHLLVCEEPNLPVTPQMAAHHLVWALEGSKWEKLKGWHTLRHSFISVCAAKGIDQRIVDAWVGHQTEEMRRRYTHLFPNQERAAMALIFKR